MKINSLDYFTIAYPGFICFILGLYFFKTKIFTPSMEKLKRDVRLNENFLFFLFCIGIVLRITSSLFSQELSFAVYLVSSVRFVASFALGSLNLKKYWKLVFFVLILELYYAFIAGMYHDALMWVIFYLLFFSYTNKPVLPKRLFGALICVVLIFFVQALKGTYRSRVVETGNANLRLVAETSSGVLNDINSEDNYFSILNRGNQAWIFASSIERMDRIGDFQELNILSAYLDAALLPRFLAPNKIKSGDKAIFNEFSGHTISDNTSMGLGVFADGYISYGLIGVLMFAFGLGLLFNICFLIIQSWSKISEFYVLMVLPILNYSIRPDCDTQTVINHTIKGLIIFWIFVNFTKYKFHFGSQPVGSSKINPRVIPNLKRIEN